MFVCFIALSISSCMWGKPSKKNHAVNRDTLTYKYTVFKQLAADCGDKPDSSCTMVKFKYPDFQRQKALNDTILYRLINQFQLNEKPDTSLKELSEKFLTNYQIFKQSRKSPVLYTLNCYAKVLRQDSSLTTLETGGYVFTGGAHPSSYTGFVNWNTKLNRNITLADLISPADMEKFKSIAENIFRKNEKLSDTASLTGNYFFKDNKFSLNNNYSVPPLGIRFLYNQYEIKPYAAGTTALLIPYSKIKSLLRPNTVTAQYTK